MKDRLRRLLRMTVALGILVLIALGLSVAALSDIAHGEPDVELEWAMIRVTALLIVLHQGLTFALIRIVSKDLGRASA